MIRTSLFRTTVAALALGLGAGAALAQTEVVAPATPNADMLAEQMRVLADNPRDLAALLRAGELSARLNDPAAAMAFFTRAEAVDAHNPRIAAGRAMVLVRAERPGEALQLFAEAEKRGANMRDYAADRAFAYDLMGAPRVAQRDYQIAMAQAPSDETIRHYALSLGISGQRDKALALLDPLLRRGDRAAWRARAFVLAMNGDLAGAEKIATSMMPGNMGQELLPFFRRLEALSPADRAFAVHFGELSPTPARLADARRAPPLPVIAPEPVQLAQTPAPAPAADKRAAGKRAERRERHARRSRRHETEVAAAVAVPTPAPPPVEPDLPPPPSAPPPEEPAPVRAAPVPAEPVRRAPPRPVRAAPPTQLAARAPAAVSPARADSALASIIGGITIPASELGVAPMPGDAPPPAEPPAESSAPPVAQPEPEAPKPAAAPVKPASKPAPKPVLKPEAKPKPKPKPDPARLEPSRVWVQVAGGANEATLPREWARLVKAAPEAFRHRSGWTTPLRATNRLLTGPFKSDDEAQDFVNLLRKQGLSAFVFTSEAGQKITKLSDK